MGEIILVARLPLGTSTNALHDYDEYTGRRRVSVEALEYTDEVLKILGWYSKASEAEKKKLAPYKVSYLNMPKICKIRELKQNKSRAKAVLAQHRLYRMDMQCIFTRGGNDLDNRRKRCQDVVTRWIGFDDSRVIEIHDQTVIDKGGTPYCDVVVREVEQTWYAGSLLELAERELAMPDMYMVQGAFA